MREYFGMRTYSLMARSELTAVFREMVKLKIQVDKIKGEINV